MDSIYLGCRLSAIDLDDDIKELLNDRRPLVEGCLRRGSQSSQMDNTNIAEPTDADTPMRGVGAVFIDCDFVDDTFSLKNGQNLHFHKANAEATRPHTTAEEARQCTNVEETQPDPLTEAKAHIAKLAPTTKCWEYNMCGHARSAVEKYTDLAKIQTKDLRMVATPCLDDSQLSQEDFDNKGRLHDIAAQVVLTCLYLARHNRPDILWSVNHLARHVTKWSQADDKRLQRLISYLHHTQHYVQQCVAGDYITDCLLVMYVDAGYAGDLGDSKSTGGAIIYLLGPNTCVPLAWVCKKQGAVSHSSTEAEIISLEMAIRMVGYPLLQLWDEILAVMTKTKRRKPDPELRRLNSLDRDYVPLTCPPPGEGKLVVLEDNDAVIKMLMKGRSSSNQRTLMIRKLWSRSFRYCLPKEGWTITTGKS